MTGKHEDLLAYLEKHNVHLVVIQEAKFTSKSKIKPSPNYTLVRKDRMDDIKDLPSWSSMMSLSK